MTAEKVAQQTRNKTGNSVALMLRNDKEWAQVFCAAITGILANPNNNGEPVDQFTDEAFDTVQFAAQVADEALGVK